MQYAIHNQRDRRNLTDADILRCVAVLDSRKQRGGDRKSEGYKSKSSSQLIDTSRDKTAEVVGTSRDKVQKARAILDHAEPETKQAVESGEKSIYQAYKVRLYLSIP